MQFDKEYMDNYHSKGTAGRTSWKLGDSMVSGDRPALKLPYWIYQVIMGEEDWEWVLDGRNSSVERFEKLFPEFKYENMHMRKGLENNWADYISALSYMYKRLREEKPQMIIKVK